MSSSARVVCDVVAVGGGNVNGDDASCCRSRRWCCCGGRECPRTGRCGFSRPSTISAGMAGDDKRRRSARPVYEKPIRFGRRALQSQSRGSCNSRGSLGGALQCQRVERSCSLVVTRPARSWNLFADVAAEGCGGGRVSAALHGRTTGSVGWQWCVCVSSRGLRRAFCDGKSAMGVSRHQEEEEEEEEKEGGRWGTKKRWTVMTPSGVTRRAACCFSCWFQHSLGNCLLAAGGWPG